MSIIYNPADFLNKNLPTTDMGYEYINLLYLNISNYVNNNVEDVNNINNDMLKALDETASLYKNTTRTLGSITNSIADVFITGGGSRDSIKIFDKELKVVSNGVIIDYDTMQIYLDRKQSIAYSLSKISINTRSGSLGNTIEDKKAYFDINNIVSSASRLEIESYESELDIDIDIDMSSNSIFNNIKFNLHNFGTRLPTIGHISVSEDGCEYKKLNIATSNSTSMDINDFDFKNGMINIHVKESSARYVRLNLIQKMSYNTGKTRRRRYAIGIDGLEMGFYSAVDSGDVIIGPIKSKDEIFKVAAYSNMLGFDIQTPNITLDLSTDQITWIPFQNSSVFDPDSELSKIINFNNIDISSVFTEEIVTKIYLKISMTSSDVSYLSPLNKRISRQIISASSANRTFPIDNITSKDYIELFNYTDIKYGTRFTIPNSVVNLNPSVTKSISYIESNGITLTQGLGIESDVIYNLEKEAFQGVSNAESLIQFKYDKVHVVRNDIIENVPTDGYDPFAIKIYGFSSVIREPTSVETKNKEFKEDGSMPVISYVNNNGLYTLIYGDKSIDIMYDHGFFLDNRETLYAVADDIDSVTVKDELGRVINVVPAFMIGDVNYISILDALVSDMPDLVTARSSTTNPLVFNKKYPLESLKDNEYAVEFGKLVFKEYFKGTIQYNKIFMSEIPTELDNSINSTRLISKSSKQIKTKYQLLDHDLENTIKLKHTNILEQSIVFDLTKSSINAFIKEVPFINGQKEFEITSRFIQTGNRNKNVVPLHPDYIDDGAIELRECNITFQRRVYNKNELIDMGDYFIDKNTEVSWNATTKTNNSILLPDDIFTSNSNDVEVGYNIIPEKKSSSGFYSIDHMRGVLHAASKIDGRTYISYQYSSVYASYPSLTRLNKKDYTISGNNLTINIDDENLSKYLLISSHTDELKIDYMETPLLLDFNLNIIDASNSI